MAKELPYFKFEPNQWDNGNIQLFSHEHKGIFIDLCCMYWSRSGELPYKLAVQKICNGNATALDSLYDENIFAIHDEKIVIEFLDEQLNNFENTSKKNRINALKRWEKIKNNATAMRPQSDRNAIREEKIREEKIREEKNIKKTPPSFEDFKNYAFEKEPLLVLSELKLKYEAWLENGWKDGHDKPIKNWKSKILQTIPHLKKEKSSAKKENVYNRF